MKKRSLLMAASLVLALLVATTGTMAYLSDTDSDVNVMTLGNVKIEQIEMQRVVKDGAWVSTGETDKYGYTPDKLEPFADLQPLYPAFFAEGSIKWDDRANGTHQQSWNQIGAPGANQLFDDSVMGVQDKFVFVKNTGSSDAYVRTWFAFEQGSFSFDAWEDTSKPTGVWTNTDGEHWTWETVASDVPIGDNTYVIQVATYVGPKNGTGILAAGATTEQFISGVYLDSHVDMVDGNYVDTRDPQADISILAGDVKCPVMAVAVQAAGFDNADAAVEAAFGANFDPFEGTNVTNWQE